jgi:hypothetical protein
MAERVVADDEGAHVDALARAVDHLPQRLARGLAVGMHADAQRPGGARPKLSIRSAAQWPGGTERGGRGEPAGRSLRWPNSRYIGRMK